MSSLAVRCPIRRTASPRDERGGAENFTEEEEFFDAARRRPEAPRFLAAGVSWRVLLAFHKPYGVISQFQSADSPHRTLADFGFPPRVYPIGRLDADSEGLLLLSDEPALNERLLDPRHAHAREYWVQVEREPPARALRDLERGVLVQGRRTLSCRAWRLDPQPVMTPRVPPIRVRKSIPACWIAIELTEGKNRQVRRMTAAIGHPTLRLIRVRIGAYELGDLAPGTWRALSAKERERVLDTGRVRRRLTTD